METTGAIGMHVAIPADLESFLEQKFATGRSGSREEVLIQALEWLSEERKQAIDAIRQGLEDAASSRTEPLVDAIDDLRREFDAAK